MYNINENEWLDGNEKQKNNLEKLTSIKTMLSKRLAMTALKQDFQCENNSIKQKHTLILFGSQVTANKSRMINFHTLVGEALFVLGEAINPLIRKPQGLDEIKASVDVILRHSKQDHIIRLFTSYLCLVEAYSYVSMLLLQL